MREVRAHASQTTRRADLRAIGEAIDTAVARTDLAAFERANSLGGTTR
jgi:hypothetical protein